MVERSSISAAVHPFLDALGFRFGNPFQYIEAESERAILPALFVNVDGFEKVKENRSMIIFAPRGCGKTALRVYLANESAPIKAESDRLAIEYVNFDRLVARETDLRAVPVEAHLREVLRQGAANLLLSLMRLPAPFLNLGQAGDAERSERLRKFPPSALPGLASMLRVFYPDLLAPEALYGCFCEWFPKFHLPFKGFSQAVQEQRLSEYLQQGETHLAILKYPPASFLAELIDMPKPAPELIAERTGHDWLIQFGALASKMGFHSVLILIDRVDEIQQTASQPERQADLLEPLLANLPLMELPGISFKFFMSREAREDLLARPTIRPDRLTDQAVKIQWSTDNLRELLNNRLEYFSDGGIHQLAQICSEGLANEADVRAVGEWIENNMLSLADGSPRRLLTAGRLLLEEYISRQGAPGELINKGDWERARARLLKTALLMVKVSPTRPLAWRGLEEVKLTRLEHNIIKVLLEGEGRCAKETLAQKAWEDKAGGVSDETINIAIKRLRQKIGDDAKEPVYLLRLGDVFELRQYVAVD